MTLGCFGKLENQTKSYFMKRIVGTNYTFDDSTFVTKVFLLMAQKTNRLLTACDKNSFDTLEDSIKFSSSNIRHRGEKINVMNCGWLAMQFIEVFS